VPCARLSGPSRQLLSARKSTVSYRWLKGKKEITAVALIHRVSLLRQQVKLRESATLQLRRRVAIDLLGVFLSLVGKP